jgi:cell division protein FtsA
MNGVVHAAASLSLPAEREIAAVIPKTFSVDHLTDVLDPRGLTGHRLEVEAHVVTGATNAMTNLERCVMDAGCEVRGRVLQPLASAASCLTADQRREGVAVVDIGGGTTDLAIYVGDACWHIAVIPMGGTLVTSDIARGLRLPSRVAEALKIQHGRIDPWVDSDESTVEAPGFDHGTPIAIRRRDLARVIDARMEEIISLVRDEIVRSGYYDVLPAGVILTGGGSLIPGLATKAAEVLELPVSLGRPKALWGLDEDMCGPQFSTAIGLTMMGATPRPDDGWLEQRATNRGGALTSIGTWVRNLVSPAAA